MEDSQSLEHQFDAMTARCGITVPADRRQGALAVHQELSSMATLLREPRDAAVEPATVFNIVAILRG